MKHSLKEQLYSFFITNADKFLFLDKKFGLTEKDIQKIVDELSKECGLYDKLIIEKDIYLFSDKYHIVYRFDGETSRKFIEIE